ncbi:MAG: hypothetical protein M1816_007636 [Peltula sp. TS41687]|nr:MAG: hypothetical protein M1816_007636 [Peltula sp. TS41687]
METRPVPSPIDLNSDDSNTGLASGSPTSAPNGMPDLSPSLRKRRKELLQGLSNSKSSKPGNAERNSKPKVNRDSGTTDRSIEGENGSNLANGNSVRASRQSDGHPSIEETSSRRIPPPVPATCTTTSGELHTSHEETSGQVACQIGLEKSDKEKMFPAIMDAVNIYRDVLSKDERRFMGAQIARKIEQIMTSKKQVPIPPVEQHEVYHELAKCYAHKMMKAEEVNKQRKQNHGISSTPTGDAAIPEQIQQLNSLTPVQTGKKQAEKGNAPIDVVNHPLRLKRTSDGQLKISPAGVIHSLPLQSHVKSNLTKITKHQSTSSGLSADVTRRRGEACSSQFPTQDPLLKTKQTSKKLTYPVVIIEIPSRKPKLSSSALDKTKSHTTSSSSSAQARVSDISSAITSSISSGRVQPQPSTKSKAHRSEVKNTKLDLSPTKATASSPASTSHLSTYHNRILNKSTVQASSGNNLNSSTQLSRHHTKAEVHPLSVESKTFNQQKTPSSRTAGETAPSFESMPLPRSLESPARSMRSRRSNGTRKRQPSTSPYRGPAKRRGRAGKAVDVPEVTASPGVPEATPWSSFPEAPISSGVPEATVSLGVPEGTEPSKRETKPAMALQRSLHSQLHYRELGLGAAAGRFSLKRVNQAIRETVYDSLKKTRIWTVGGSSDVVSVAWSPDDNTFGVGCAALTDDDNMQYNRENNLLLGGLSQNVIRELPDHRLGRVRPASGANSNLTMFRTLDPWLYYTVSSVDFSPDGHRMYTASYDKTVKVWDVEQSTARGRLLKSFEHGSEVDVVSATTHHPNLIATACQSVVDGVRIFEIESGAGVANNSTAKFSSAKASKHPEKKMYPSCIRWGLHTNVNHLLLAGFSSNPEDDGRVSREGDLSLFDVQKEATIKVTPSAQNVFDCVWHSELPWFAVGCAANSRANRGVGSYIRLFQGAVNRATYELECPAIDQNDITWCQDWYYCTASCTDGTTYVWDLRNPDRILHQLKHGDPTEELPDDNESWAVRKERHDTGVRFAQWGHSPNRFYTGSSDGVVKVWDIKRAPENAHIKDLVQLESGVMSGSFTKDYSRLLLGDAQGHLTILETGFDDYEDDDSPQVRNLGFERAPNRDLQGRVEDPFEAARGMLARGEMVYDDSHGLRQVVRGPNYNGPFVSDEYRKELKRAHKNASKNSIAESGNFGTTTKKTDGMMEKSMSNGVKHNVSKHIDKDGKEYEVIELLDSDTDDGVATVPAEEELVESEPMAGWPFPEDVREDYAFDCGIYSNNLLPTDLEQDHQTGNDMA